MKTEYTGKLVILAVTFLVAKNLSYGLIIFQYEGKKVKKKLPTKYTPEEVSRLN